MTAPTTSDALELIGVSHQFGAVRALDDVSFSARPGSVHALLGENGAGKTTLMRVAYGLLEPTHGRIRLFGREIVGHSVREAMRSGVGMVHQQLSLVATLTAAENIALGRRGLFRPARARAELDDLIQSSGLRVDADALARDLTIVQQQRLEILKALVRGARVLILDEPTSGLAPAEIDDLLRWIREFADRGGTVILVTHKLREALAVADDVTVLRRGRAAHRERILRAGADASTVEQLARAIFPAAPATAPREPDTVQPGPVVAAVHDVTVLDDRGASRLRSVSLELRRGEVLGVAAVEGSGHRELMAVAAGLLRPAQGRVELPARIALVPADRARNALIPDFTLVENVALRGAGDRTGRMAWRAMEEHTAALVDRFSVVAASPHVPVRTLSGGNQQRLVVARELSGDVDLVIADDPSRGLDLRATAFVHDQLRDVSSRGAGVLVHFSDLDELLDLATRIVVVFHGAVRDVPLDRDLVGQAMLGGA
ncbi:MAG: ABC transporter ATP-binding protein [Gemmatimonadaceae bacterium]